METFYDGDLKDIWDSDLDPTDSLKLSTDSDMHDWFLERDVKDAAVILNDKLISDALLNGTLPIKSEHSYSLNSDGDSLPDSPHSLHAKMDDMEDECYPAISLKTATSNLRGLNTTATIDPKCLTITCSSNNNNSTQSISSLNPLLTSISASENSSSSSSNSSSCNNNNNNHTTSNNNTNVFSNNNMHSLQLQHQQALSKMVSNQTNIGGTSIALNLHRTFADTNSQSLNFNTNSSSSNNKLPALHHLQQRHQQHLEQFQQQQQQQKQQNQQQFLPHNNNNANSEDFQSLLDNDCASSTSSRSQSPDICSDIEIDESCIKNEPMSPDSSCPPSPHTAELMHSRNSTGNSGTLSLTMANMAAFTNSDLVFEHKNGMLQLTPSSQSLLKSQQIILTNTNAAQNIVIPKFTIKTENSSGVAAAAHAGGLTQIATISHATTTTPSSATTVKTTTAYGLPLTPPCSLSSDGSDGNLTPEHMMMLSSPQSPSCSMTTNSTSAVTTPTRSGNSGILTVTSVRRNTNNSSASSTSSSSSVSISRHMSGGGGGGGGTAGGGTNGSTRQPIHTPLISSQPKGSTGTLLLTEEEKRTLLAEGYPIPQKLPLTKAEEKSLKKIRRKIKNKISAQESRRKKKEYMDQLERKVEILVTENNDYKKRLQNLEDTNTSLLSQLHKLQAMVNKQQHNLKKS